MRFTSILWRKRAADARRPVGQTPPKAAKLAPRFGCSERGAQRTQAGRTGACTTRFIHGFGESASFVRGARCAMCYVRRTRRQIGAAAALDRLAAEAQLWPDGNDIDST